MPQPPEHRHERRRAQVDLGLPPPVGKHGVIHRRAARVVRVGEAGEVSAAGERAGADASAARPARSLRPQVPARHGPVGHPERVPQVGVLAEERNGARHPVGREPRVVEQLPGRARRSPSGGPPASSCRRASIQMRTWWTAFRMLPPASETPRSIGASATTDSADIRPHPARSLPQAVTWAVSRGPSRPRGSRPSSPRPHAAAPASRARTCPSSSRSASGRGSP